MCRSALFSSSSRRTSAQSALSTLSSRSVMSLCTVDLETPKALAAARTVARFSVMYSASLTARSSMSVLIYTTPGFSWLII